jgi:hypothetical protein
MMCDLMLRTKKAQHHNVYHIDCAPTAELSRSLICTVLILCIFWVIQQSLDKGWVTFTQYYLQSTCMCNSMTHSVKVSHSDRHTLTPTFYGSVT